MRLSMKVEKSDLIIGLGVQDVRVAERSAQLFLDGYGKEVIFSGGYGRITKNTNSATEAETFKQIALGMGVPSDNILLEDKASNTGENIRFTQELIESMENIPSSMIIVTKPYMERRVLATFMKVWSGPDIDIIITSPEISYEESYNEQISKDLFLNVMVGDLQRVKLYPEKGFQIEQDIPANVWNAYEELVKTGYNKQLIKE